MDGSVTTAPDAVVAAAADALDMALNAAAAVRRYAEAQNADPVTSHIERYGERGHESARLAGDMALVSIAANLARLVDLLEPAIREAHAEAQTVRNPDD